MKTALLFSCVLGLLAWTAIDLRSSDVSCERAWPVGTTSCELHGRLVPPSHHTVFKDDRGAVLGSATVPDRQDYLVMLAAFAFPLVVLGLTRARGRARGSRSRRRA